MTQHPAPSAPSILARPTQPLFPSFLSVLDASRTAGAICYTVFIHLTSSRSQTRATNLSRCLFLLHNSIFLPSPVSASRPPAFPNLFFPPSSTEHYRHACVDALREAFVVLPPERRAETVMRRDKVELRVARFRTATVLSEITAPPEGQSRRLGTSQTLVHVHSAHKSCRAECFHQGNGLHVFLSGSYCWLRGSGSCREWLSWLS